MIRIDSPAFLLLLTLSHDNYLLIDFVFLLFVFFLYIYSLLYSASIIHYNRDLDQAAPKHTLIGHEGIRVLDYNYNFLILILIPIRYLFYFHKTIDVVCSLSLTADGNLISGSWDKYVSSFIPLSIYLYLCILSIFASINQSDLLFLFQRIRTARVWRGGDCIQTLKGHTHAVWAVLGLVRICVCNHPPSISVFLISSLLFSFLPSLFVVCSFIHSILPNSLMEIFLLHLQIIQSSCGGMQYAWILLRNIRIALEL